MKIKDNQIAAEAFNFLNIKNFDLAEKLLVKLIKKYPVDINFLNALAFAKFNLNKIDQSINLQKKSLSINPHQIETIQNLILNQIGKKNYIDALETAKDGIKYFPENFFMHYLQGNVFLQLEKFNDAILSYQHSIKLNPKAYDSYLNMGYTYNKSKNFLDAIKSFQLALSIKKDLPTAYYNLAIAYNNIRDYKNAILNYETFIKMDPASDTAKFNLGVLYLSQKQFSDGWKLWEYRWKAIQKPEFTNRIETCNSIEKNKKILIWGEQGLGEQILYGSMLNDLNKYENLTVALNQRLLKIFERSFQKIKFIDLENINNEVFNSQIAMGSLGALLRRDNKSFKGQPKRYLYADKKKCKEFKDKINSKKKLLCGLSWISKNQFIGSDKSIKLEKIIDVLNPKKFEFIDLQYGDNKKEIEDIKKNHNIDVINIDGLDKFNDIDGLLSLIDVCDVVVSVSNITAHLSGALGKKTFMLAPHEYGSMWHWHNGNDTPWYPSVKIFRKKSELSWTEALKELSNEMLSL